jgi:hypothetical protein
VSLFGSHSHFQIESKFLQQNDDQFLSILSSLNPVSYWVFPSLWFSFLSDRWGTVIKDETSGVVFCGWFNHTCDPSSECWFIYNLFVSQSSWFISVTTLTDRKKKDWEKLRVIHSPKFSHNLRTAKWSENHTKTRARWESNPQRNTFFL